MNSKTLVKPHSFQRTQLQEKIEEYEKGENKVKRNWNKLSDKNLFVLTECWYIEKLEKQC